MPAGFGSRGAGIQTSCAVVSAPTLDRAFASWCLTVEAGDWDPIPDRTGCVSPSVVVVGPTPSAGPRHTFVGSRFVGGPAPCPRW